MSPSASDVSIVTVNWNGKDHLVHLLPSLAALACREIILVDNGSTDGSQEWVREKHPQVKILQNDVNRGFAQPNNLGVRRASGRCVAFINNDMRADRHWIDAALWRLSGDTPCVASRILDWEGGQIDFNGSSLQYLGFALQRDIGKLVDEVSCDEQILFPCGGAMLIDREIFLELGGFDEDYFAIYEDVDLGWRLWISGYQVGFAPDSVVYHRGHGTFQAHANEKMRYLMHRNAMLTILKNYEEETFRKILPLAVVMAIKRAILLSGVEKEHFYLWSDTRRRLTAGDPAFQSRLVDAFNHLVALDDVLESLPRTLEKRRAVQARRKRADAEILNLFVDPLRPIVEDPAYIAEELRYLELLDFSSLFDLTDYRRHLDRLPAALQSKIENLERELRGRQRIGVNKFLHRACRRAGSWKQEGLRAALRRFMEQVDRGI